MAVNTDVVIREAREELKQRVAIRESTDRRIADLRILLKSLMPFVPKESDREALLREVEAAKRKSPSLPEAVSDLLRGKEEPMTSTQIREALERSGFDLEEYSQPLAAVMTVLSRLVDQEKVKRDLTKDRTVLFKWAAK
jgi:hypothetical protein